MRRISFHTAGESHGRGLVGLIEGIPAGLSLEMERDVIVSYDQFVVELIQAIDGATYKTPVEGDAALVASAVEVRGLSFDSVALLGLAEGDFPRAEQEDVLLRESDRAWLADRGFAIEPRLQGD